MKEQEILRRYNITKLQKDLVDTMIEVGLSHKISQTILSWIKTPQQELDMLEYIQRHKKNITDHQVIQHLAKMIQRD